MSRAAAEMKDLEVEIASGDVLLKGELCVPMQAEGLVLFAHGSGSSRHSPRNQYVASELREAGLATLLFDLLTTKEEGLDTFTRQFRFDIEFLARRLVDATRWIIAQPQAQGLRPGFFGASTGGAAALVAAARLSDGEVGAVVSRGGRPDLAGPLLAGVKCPTLLIVGGHDEMVVEFNTWAYDQLTCEKELLVIPGATHLFEEPGALEEVARRAATWFSRHLGGPGR
jgi:pimeloyl-ACP methyl ester carboxylesterase